MNLNPNMVLVGLALGAIITIGLFRWLRWLKRQEQHQKQREELELPWTEHLDGTLARRLTKQIVATVGCHWPLVLNWALQHKWEKNAAAIVLEPNLALALVIGNEQWVSHHDDCVKVRVPMGKWSLGLQVGIGRDKHVSLLTASYYIEDSKPPEFVDVLKVEDLDCIARGIMSLHPHPRQLLAVLNNDVIKQRLLHGLGYPEALARSAITSTDPLDRSLSLADGETALGEVIRMRDGDANPPEQLSDTV